MTLALLIVLSVLGVLAIIPASLFAMFSPMAFDAPGSNNDPTVWAIFIGMVSAPFVMLTSLATAWLLYWRRFRRVAVSVAAVPTLMALSVVGLWVASTL
jgi:O-antigen/teichoic acid export membrane protein